MDTHWKIDYELQQLLLKLEFIKDDNANFINYDKKVEVEIGYSSKKYFITIRSNDILYKHLVYPLNFYEENIPEVIDIILNMNEFKGELRRLKIKKIKKYVFSCKY